MTRIDRYRLIGHGALTALLVPFALAAWSVTLYDGTAYAHEHALVGVAESRDLTVKVVVMAEKGGGHGSGAVISRAGHIITDEHVVHGAKSISVRLERGDSTLILPATVVEVDVANDLAVVKVDRTFTSFGVFEDPHAIQVGDDVYNWGYPYSLAKTLGKGYISQLELFVPPDGSRRGLLTDRMHMQVPDGHGTSGSALFSARTGRIVGIMKAYAVFGGNSSPLFVREVTPVTTVLAFLRAHKIPHTVAPSQAP